MFGLHVYYIYIYVRTYVCMYVYMYVYVCVYVCMYVYIYICICMYMYVYVCICMYLYVCVYVYIYICIYIYIYVLYVCGLGLARIRCKVHQKYRVLSSVFLSAWWFGGLNTWKTPVQWRRKLSPVVISGHPWVSWKTWVNQSPTPSITGKLT